MKKNIIIAAMTGILALMTGCGTTAATSSENSPASKPAASSAAESASESMSSAAETPSSAETSSNENTTAAASTDNNTPTEKTTEVASPSPDAADFLFDGYVVTQQGDLNLRKEPDINSDAIASIPNGTELGIYSCSTDGWYMTSYNDKVGYVSSNYINKTSEEEYNNQKEQPNEYGFYPMTELPPTSVSVTDLEGTWHNGDDTITFYNCNGLSGQFDMVSAGKSVQGKVKFEYSYLEDGLVEWWYNLYDNDGTFVIGFYTESGIQLADIYAGKSREIHYTRPLEE